MIEVSVQRSVTLLKRELQEYRLSLCLTPLMVAAGLLLVLLAVSLLVNRAVSPDGLVSQLILNPPTSANSASLRIDSSPQDGSVYEYQVERPLETKPDDTPSGDGLPSAAQEVFAQWHSLHPLLNALHDLMLLLLILLVSNYLLAALFNDRRDSSILFWKSLPVSEWEQVLHRYSMGMLVVPWIVLLASWLLQAGAVLLFALLAWRADLAPIDAVLTRLDITGLWASQLYDLCRLSVSLAPVYAVLLLASAAARRSPLVTLAAPLIVIVVVERLLFGTRYASATMSAFLPQLGGDGSLLVLPQAGPWLIAAGFVAAAVALATAVYLRRFHFEL
tara:strand:- start:347915 stop:348913 length:999 start_codon:yes stop_codon:yes gene_type:complete